MKLVEHIIKSPIIGSEPQYVLPTLITVCMFMLEAAVFIDRNVFDNACKDKIMNDIGEMYDGKRGMTKIYDEATQKEVIS